MTAAAAGLTPIVELLLEKGADLDARTADGQTAWLLAAMNNQLEVVEVFKRVRAVHPHQPDGR